MRYIAFLLLPLFSCGEPESIPADLLLGQEAKIASEEWREGLDMEWGYPLEYNLAVNIGLEGDSTYHGSTGSLVGDVDIALQGPWTFQLSGRGRVTDSVTGNFGAEVAMAAGKERLQFEARLPQGGGNTGTSEQPMGGSLSMDRLQMAFQAINDAFSNAMDEEQLDELAAANFSFGFYRNLEGISDFFDPATILTSFQDDSVELMSFHKDAKAVHLKYGVSYEGFLSNNPDIDLEELPFDDIEQLVNDMVIEVSFREDNGFPISFMVDFPHDEKCTNHGSHALLMHFELTYGIRTNPIPPFEFANPGAAVDLDQMFDAFWPALQAQLSAAIEETFMNGPEGQTKDDFSF